MEQQPAAVPPNMELLPTDALLIELLSRFDHAAFVGMGVITGKPGEHGNAIIRRAWVGNTHTVRGLLADMSDECGRDYRNRTAGELGNGESKAEDNNEEG